jgi:hypothetical protein
VIRETEAGGDSDCCQSEAGRRWPFKEIKEGLEESSREQKVIRLEMIARQHGGPA